VPPTHAPPAQSQPAAAPSLGAAAKPPVAGVAEKVPDERGDAPELRRRPSLARRLSRTLFGSNKSNVLDDLPTTYVSTFKRNDMDGLEDAVSVAVYNDHALAVTKDGRLIAVGDNSLGQLDASRKPDAFQAGLKSVTGLENVASVSTSARYSAATTRDGLVFAWGTNTHLTLGHSKANTSAPVAPRLLDGAIRREKCVQVACSERFLLVLTDRGVVWACGDNVATPAAAANDGVAQPLKGVLAGLMIASICAGPSHALLISATGLVFALGSNESGALGIDPEQVWQVALPALVPLDAPVCFAACGSEHSALVTVHGQVLTCGSGLDGNLGRDLAASASPHWKPSLIAQFTKPVRTVACGDTHTLLVNEDGSVQSFGAAFPEHEAFAPVPLGPGRRAVKVAAGGSASAVIVVDASASLSALPRQGPHMNRLDAGTLVMLADKASETGSLGALMGALSEMHLPCLNRSFLLPGVEVDVDAPQSLRGQTQSGVDVASFTHAMRRVWLAFEKADAAWLASKTDSLHGELLEFAPRAALGEHLRAYLLCFLNPFVTLLPLPSLIKLVKAWAALPSAQLKLVVEWAVHDLPVDVLKEAVVRRLLIVVDAASSAQDWTDRAGVAQATAVLACVRDVAGDKLSISDFYAAQPSKWGAETLLIEFGRFIEFELLGNKSAAVNNDGSNGGFVSLFSTPFVLSAETKRDVMQAEAQFRMASAVLVDLTTPLLVEQGPHQNVFLEFVVRRDALVPDVMQCVDAAKKEHKLLKPLRIVFQGEEGLDFGGVRKEFFELLSALLFKDCFKVADTQAGMLWFDPNFDDLTRLELVGTLIGLALFNSTLLDVHFPRALYATLLGSPVANPSLDDLADVDPSLSHGLQAMLNLPSEEFDAAFEGLTFEGLKADGQTQVVDINSRDEYVRLRVRNFLYDAVEAKLAALGRGFASVCGDAKALRLFRPLELELALIGEPTVDVAALKKNTAYEGYSESTAVVGWFWDVVEHELDNKQQAALLAFTTGSSRTPIGGALAIRVQRAGPDSEQLPTSHTCFNTLLLPEYSHRDKLRDKLVLALDNSKGFGLR